MSCDIPIEWESYTCRTCDEKFPMVSHPPTMGRWCSPRCHRLHETCSVEAIWERDLRTCHLCGRYVERAEASRDHLVPRSKGGVISPQNVRLAHVLCNSARGNTDLESAA